MNIQHTKRNFQRDSTKSI